ncbi:hypothetical protein SAMN07250955_11355 [Arboricoccus pini]|uniref:Glycosyl hydrolase catalytic core n=1 Tax=Arboricoccus pini TaxID=1963835 RepID=A0A212RSK2_9PROT|nr:hypothetical protein [Arboricoccus pini]SNB75464.1 hypothetical protein SAMN07250955_11355 [Arboricoccus pini]
MAKVTRRSLVAGSAMLGLAPRRLWAAAATGHLTLQPSGTARDFLDSVGVSAHWDYRDTSYGRYRQQIAQAIVDLGVRHLRGYDPEFAPELASRGVMSLLTAGPEYGSPATIATLVRKANAKAKVLAAIEGPNEPDLFWRGPRYRWHGQGFPEGVLSYQRDLYTYFKSAPDLADLTIIGPSLGRTYDPGGGYPNPFAAGSLTDAVDWGNFHPYPGGNPFSPPFRYGGIARYYSSATFPSAALDEFPANFTTYAPPFAPKPMSATETGYSTFAGGSSEATQAKYMPRLVAEYFRLGIKRAYLYEIIDLRPDPGGQERDSHFGLLRADATPKPAYRALKGLLDLLDDGQDGTPASSLPAPVELSFSLPEGYDRPQYVHALLLRRSLQDLVLLYWHEVASSSSATKPFTDIEVPEGDLSLSLSPGLRAVAWHRYAADGTFVRHAVEGRTPLPSLPLEDRIVAVVLRQD